MALKPVALQDSEKEELRVALRKRNTRTEGYIGAGLEYYFLNWW